MNQRWWGLYARNAAHFESIAARVGVTGYNPWRHIPTLNFGAASSELGHIWAVAPDLQKIYKWPGFNALCDLLSDFEPEDYDNETKPFKPRLLFTGFVFDAAARLCKFDDDEYDPKITSLVAGGFLRDLVADPMRLRKFPTQDIDVFATRDGAMQLIREFGDSSADSTLSSDSSSGGNAVHKRTKIGDIDIIEVTDPLAVIYTFDSPANMLYAGEGGGIYAVHERTWSDIDQRIYSFNELCNSGIHGFKARALKFAARGWTIEWPNGPNGHFIDDLWMDELRKIPGSKFQLSEDRHKGSNE